MTAGIIMVPSPGVDGDFGLLEVDVESLFGPLSVVSVLTISNACLGDRRLYSALGSLSAPVLVELRLLSVLTCCSFSSFLATFTVGLLVSSTVAFAVGLLASVDGLSPQVIFSGFVES